MATGIFKSPKSALVFMGITLGSVLLLVGTEDNDGALVVAADEIGGETAELQGREVDRFAAQPHARRPAQNRPTQSRIATPEVDSPFASDDELINDAAGFDPTPPEQRPFDNTQPLVTTPVNRDLNGAIVN